jgi:hypothetical protein
MVQGVGFRGDLPRWLGYCLMMTLALMVSLALSLVLMLSLALSLAPGERDGVLHRMLDLQTIKSHFRMTILRTM